MIIYHGHALPNKLEEVRSHSSRYSHGAEFGRHMFLGESSPYIIDNGAYSAHINGEEWDSGEFEDMVEWAHEREREPDFVVVPDVVGDAQATFERSKEWVGKIPFDTYQPVQDGMGIDKAIEFTQDTGSVGIFVGGSEKWKRQTAREWVAEAHKAGLKAHIGRPGGVSGILAAERWGADSVDTVTIVRGNRWWMLKELEEQRGLTDF